MARRACAPSGRAMVFLHPRFRRPLKRGSFRRLRETLVDEENFLPQRGSRPAFSVVGVKKTWRTPEGQRLESHTKTLMERASSLNQLSPLPKIGEGFGEWSEALLRIKEGWVVVTMQG